jgi:ankyrin repeat protein
VRSLLDAGADPDATAFGLLSPVHTAAAAGDIDALALLLEHGADAEPAVDAAMESPEQVAARLAIAETAILRQADPQMRDVIADLVRSSRAGHLEIVAAYRLRAGAATTTPTT